MESYTAPITPSNPDLPIAADQVNSQPAPQPPQPSAAPPKSGKKMFIILGVLLLLVAVAVVALLLFRNTLFGSATNKDATLTYWGLWEDSQTMQGLIEEYRQEHPNITINYEERPLANHYTAVRSRISSSTSTNSPDIVRLHSSWVPVLSNYLSPLPTNLMTKDQYQESFYSVTADTLYKSNNYYGIPLSIDGLALVYNQDLMNQAGVTAVPATWDDVRQAAAKITKKDAKGAITTGGIAMGTANNVDHFSEILGLLMAQNGVSITNSQGQVTFGNSLSPDGNNLGAEALAFYTLFSTTEKVWADNLEASTLAFSKGNVGMILVPSWRVASLVEQNPQLQIRVTAAPQLAANQNVGYASYWVETVPKTSSNQAEAWKFLTWLSQKEQQKKLFSSSQDIHSLAQAPANKAAASIVSSDILLAPYIDQAAGYRASIFASNTGAQELNGEIDAALAEAITAALKGSDRQAAAAEALTAAATQVGTILSKQR